MNENDSVLDLVMKAAASDKVSSTDIEKGERPLTFKRDEHGVLWSYDQSGKKVGRIFEHGDSQIDTIKEV